jgi:hypothetical protein
LRPSSVFKGLHRFQISLQNGEVAARWPGYLKMERLLQDEGVAREWRCCCRSEISLTSEMLLQDGDVAGEWSYCCRSEISLISETLLENGAVAAEVSYSE